jgi:hypothetical protein
MRTALVSEDSTTVVNYVEKLAQKVKDMTYRGEGQEGSH